MVNFKLNNYSFSYPGEEKESLRSISLEINQGEFIVLCGRSGSGKSTLLASLKPELTPRGKSSGEILFFGKAKEDFTQRDSAENIGFMLQNVKYQAVTHTVRSELAFGLESLGFESNTIRLRIAEICAYFSLNKIIDKKTSELSGGQKQLLCLAAIVAMHPKVIILDEPTSQLDPMSAVNFLDTAQRLCKENAITLIVSEHRLESLIPVADRVIIMEDGRIISDCHGKDIDSTLIKNNDFVSSSMPFSARLHTELKLTGEKPLSVSQGRKVLENAMEGKIKYTKCEEEKRQLNEEIAIEVKNLSFAYDNKGYVLKNLSLDINKGSFTALMGANGAGKTTLLHLMCGVLPCKMGKIKLLGEDIKKRTAKVKLALLPQECESLFGCNTIKEDLEYVLKSERLTKEERENKIARIADFTEITPIILKHPYDVSGGEMQRAALAMVLLKEPDIIFLDEPTKGMDNLFKRSFAKKIKELCQNGVTVVMVSHDTEFCAEYCDECAMIFDGYCVCKKSSHDFFSQNYFYTTGANKISRGIFDGAVTGRQVLSLCEKNLQS